MMDRRKFLELTAGVAGYMAIARRGYAYSSGLRLRKFVEPIRRFGLDIPILSPDTATYPGIDYYDVEGGVYRDILHPDLPHGTRLYGYRQRDTGTYKHLGGAIVARRNRPVRIKFTCSLPSQHILPFDPTVSEGPGGNRADRAVIHLHGGRVPWPSDGGPFHWVANAANGTQAGPSVPAGWLPDATGHLTNDSFYPNNQSARMMWFHDHAIGITRLNAYAGLASGYFLIDDVELGMASRGLPLPGDVLAIQDKVFFDPASDAQYASYAGPGVLGGAIAGDLWYPYLYEPDIWELEEGSAPPPQPSVVAEMFGSTMLVNGTAYPFQNVNGMKRFRVLNACNARFLNLSFAVEDPLRPGEPLGGSHSSNQGAPVWAPVKVWQIGSEGGFLPQPVLLADTAGPRRVPPTPLLLGPAERADLIVDFSAVPIGMGVLLYNDAPAPFPGGNRDFDFGPHERKQVTLGPDTRALALFRRVAGAGESFPIPMPAPGTTLVPLLPTVPDAENGGFKLDIPTGGTIEFAGAHYDHVPTTQELTLNESFDGYGRLTQLLGNLADPAGAFGSGYTAGAGEHVNYGTIQVWNIYNLTADTHPMHFHLFNVMVLRRAPCKLDHAGVPRLFGRGRGPEPNETGWKETVRMNPGECTTVAVLVENPFDLPEQPSGVKGNSATRRFSWKKNGTTVTSNPVPSSPRLSKELGITADEYVWHCHILEHEEHDMMHPLIAT